jgi:hypothetical protein
MDRAFESRASALRSLVERDSGFRWHDRRWRRELATVEFDRQWFKQTGDVPYYAKER